MSTKLDRTKLRTYFETGDRPTEGEFIEFIDSMIIQKSDEIHVDDNNNVGVGEETPLSKLHVGGTITVDENVIGTKQDGAMQVINGASIQLFGKTSPSKPGDIVFLANNSSGSGAMHFVQELSPGYRKNMLIDADGNVEIGTSNHGSTLQITADGNSTGLKLPGGAANNYVLMTDAAGKAEWQPPSMVNDSIWKYNGSNIHNVNGGNVGVGTNDPKSTLHIDGNFKIDSDKWATLRFENTIPTSTGSDPGSWLIQECKHYNKSSAFQQRFPDGQIGFQAKTLNGGSAGAGYVGLGSQTSDLYFSAGNGKSLMICTDNSGANMSAQVRNDKNWHFYDNQIFLRPNWNIPDKNFNGLTYDNGGVLGGGNQGPFLFGYRGGGLGTATGTSGTPYEDSTRKVALSWANDQSVDFKGKVTVNGDAPFLFIKRTFTNTIKHGVRLGVSASDYGAVVVVGFDHNLCYLNSQVHIPNTPQGNQGIPFKISAHTWIDGPSNEWWVQADVLDKDSEETWTIAFMYVKAEFVQTTGFVNP